MDDNLQLAFRKIYLENLWGSQESRSGPGSTLEITEELRKVLPKFLEIFECKILLDAPCGDFHWMKEVDLGDIIYIGADIVPELIENHNKHFASEKRNFKLLDITGDPLPKADVWLCRDVMLHLPLASIMKLLNNFLNSEIKYLMASHYTWAGDNEELYSIVSGRSINLTKKPFLLPQPLYTIKDFVLPGPHVSLGVWSRTQVISEFKRNQEIISLILKKEPII